MVGFTKYRPEAEDIVMKSEVFNNITMYTNGTTMMNNSHSVRTSCDTLHDENDIFTAALAGCPISWIHDNDEYRGPSFNGSGIIKVLHNTPRLGKSNDISTITHDNGTQWNDYKRGLMGLSIFACVFFILWFLLISYCQYTKRMGWLAGGPPTKPVSIYYDTRLHNRDLAKYKKQVNILRYVVLFSGMAIIVLSGLLLGSGFHSLSNAVQSAQNILPPTIELLSEATKATEAYVAQAYRTDMADMAFLHTLRTDCPSVNTSSMLNNNNNKSAMEMISGTTNSKISAGSVLKDSSNNTDMNVSISINNNNEMRNSTLSTIMFANVNDTTISGSTFAWETTEENTTQINETTTDHGGPFYQDAMTNISAFFRKAVNDVMDLEESISIDNDMWVYIASSMIIAINFITLVFMIGVILAWKENQPRLFLHTTNRCMLPFFSILIIMTFLLSTACLIWSELLSDLCTGNPDDQVKKLIDPSHPADEFVGWYLGGCMAEDQPGTIPSLVKQLTPAVLSMLAFGKDYLNTSVPIIDKTLANASQLLFNTSDPHRYLQEEFSDLVGTQYCGDNTQNLQASYETLITKLFSLLELATDLIPILRCDRLNHIYTRFTYQTACEDGINATALVFLYMFLVSFFGMVIVTARAAWQHVEMFASEFETFHDTDEFNDACDDEFEEYREDQQNRRRRRRRLRYYSGQSSDQSGTQTTYGTKHVDTNMCC